MKICKFCNNSFESSQKNQKYCGAKCREKQNGKWNYERHKPARLKYARDHQERANELNKTPKRRAHHAQYSKNRRASDPIYKMKINIIDRCRRDESCNRQFSCKRLEDSLPHSYNDMWEKLVSTIPFGYSPKDYLNGTLEIDHIIPVSKYIILEMGDNEFKKCWNKRNLRLVVKEKNRERGHKIFNFEEVKEYQIEDLLPMGADIIYKNLAVYNKSVVL